MSFRKIARFVTRPSYDKNNPDQAGMFIGSVFLNTGDIFKGDRVYEIQDILGELVIRDVGPCVLSTDNRKEGLDFVNWNWCVSDILKIGKKWIFLTVDEYKQQLKREDANEAN